MTGWTTTKKRLSVNYYVRNHFCNLWKNFTVKLRLRRTVFVGFFKRSCTNLHFSCPQEIWHETFLSLVENSFFLECRTHLSMEIFHVFTRMPCFCMSSFLFAFSSMNEIQNSKSTVLIEVVCINIITKLTHSFPWNRKKGINFSSSFSSKFTFCLQAIETKQKNCNSFSMKKQ